VAVQPSAHPSGCRAIAEGSGFATRPAIGSKFSSPRWRRPFRPAAESRFRPIDGHGACRVPCRRVDDLQWFYQDLLGFRLSDLRAAVQGLLSSESRHHSLALIETGRRGIHHVMMEVMNLTMSARPTTSRRPNPDGSAPRWAGTPTTS
jgi:hypothetical protein